MNTWGQIEFWLGTHGAGALVGSGALVGFEVGSSDGALEGPEVGSTHGATGTWTTDH